LSKKSGFFASISDAAGSGKGPIHPGILSALQKYPDLEIYLIDLVVFSPVSCFAGLLLFKLAGEHLDLCITVI
jgi:hypothetical protein